MDTKNEEHRKKFTITPMNYIYLKKCKLCYSYARSPPKSITGVAIASTNTNAHNFTFY